MSLLISPQTTKLLPRKEVGVTPEVSVPDDASSLNTAKDQSFQNRAIGIVVSNTVIWFAVVTALFWLFQKDFAGAVALGAYCAFWFGPGLGAMMAMATWDESGDHAGAH